MLNRIRSRAASTLHIPQDVILGEPVITVTGRRQVYIENYRRIVSIRDEEIRIQARTCRIVITGRRLMIEYYTRDDMVVVGQITSVCTENQ